MPIKPLSFKGDKKAKKRKHRDRDDGGDGQDRKSSQRPGDDGNNNEADDDGWTTPDAASDLTGPVILVLPTTPPTCLASDAHGNVFASVLENIVEGHADTAEPHDVRQVWVASQVAGTGTGGTAAASQLNLKASHGGYLSCDYTGVLAARREARGVEEGFQVEEIGADGSSSGNSGRLRWRLKTCAGQGGGGGGSEGGATAKTPRYLSATAEVVVKKEGGRVKQEDEDDRKTVAITLRGDGDAGDAATELVIKMQARFKPRVQQTKASKANEKISRREMEHAVGRRLEDDEVKRLKRARKNGTYHEELLDVRVKGKHDKFA